MHIRQLPADEAAVRRYLEALWLPYNRELEATVDNFALAEDVDVIEEELEYRLERLEAESYRTWIAVAGSHDEDSIAVAGGEFAGFIVTEIDEPPSIFERPDRLLVCDIYVRESYRGTGLARQLIDHARTRARENDCGELTLEVDVDNDRAIAFYEKLGFEPIRRTLAISVTGV